MRNLRPYRSYDADQVAELWWESWRSTGLPLVAAMSVEKNRERLEEEGPQWEIFVTTDAEGEIIAFIALSLAEHRLRQLFVSPSHQFRGVGSELLELAKVRMPEGFWLWTPPGNLKARRFYDARSVTYREMRQSPDGPMAVHAWPS